MMEHSLEFTVKWRKDYHQNKKKAFSVKELGRHFGENPLDIETWSRESGELIPDDCKVPFVNPPKSLPISLKLKRWSEDKDIYYNDVTNKHPHSFSFKLPPKDLHKIDFLNRFYCTENCLTWALREKVDLSGADFFIMSGVLRDIASCAYLNRLKPDWKFAVLLYKDKIFIDDILSHGQRTSIESSRECGTNFKHRKKFIMPRFRSKGSKRRPRISVSHSVFPEEYLGEREYSQHGKKFEDVMKSGGPGDPLYDGKDVDVRSTRCISLGHHKIITATRLCCQSREGPVDSLENYVELKTILRNIPHTTDKLIGIKSCSLWIHCALVGIETVYCGIRNDDGLLIEVKRHTMDDLANIGERFWSPNEILTFLDTVLIWIKKKLNRAAIRRRKDDEQWLKEKLLAEKAPTFTLSCNGDGFIRLTPEDHPEFRKVITEKYDHIGQNKRNEHSPNVNVKEESGYLSDHSEVPDNWDDSDNEVPDNWDDSDNWDDEVPDNWDNEVLDNWWDDSD